MVSDTGFNNKKLYSYFKSMKSGGSGVAPLKKGEVSYSDEQDKTKILNDQFSSEYTTEDVSSIPDLGSGIALSVPPIRIYEERVRKILRGLKQHKDTSADQISARFLKEMASSIAPTDSYLPGFA